MILFEIIYIRMFRYFIHYFYLLRVLHSLENLKSINYYYLHVADLQFVLSK